MLSEIITQQLLKGGEIYVLRSKPSWSFYLSLYYRVTERDENKILRILLLFIFYLTFFPMFCLPTERSLPGVKQSLHVIVNQEIIGILSRTVLCW